MTPAMIPPMIPYEYKVIPAPTRGLRGKGVKGADGKFAHALEQVMNQMGAQGWEFQRSETLPSEERAGLTSKTTVFRNVLVFRRPLDSDAAAFDPKLLEPPTQEDAAEPDADQPRRDETGQDEHEHEGTGGDETGHSEPGDFEDDEPDDVASPLRARAEQLAAKAGDPAP